MVVGDHNKPKSLKAINISKHLNNTLNQTRRVYLQFLFFLQDNVFADDRGRDDKADYDKKRHLELKNLNERVFVIGRIWKALQQNLGVLQCRFAAQFRHYTDVDGPLHQKKSFVEIALAHAEHRKSNDIHAVLF